MIEERTGEIEFRVVNNDNTRESLIILTGLKCIFQKQLPKMPKDYIARLVYDRTHLSMAIVKKPLEVVGYATHHLRLLTKIADKHQEELLTGPSTVANLPKSSSVPSLRTNKSRGTVRI